MTKGEFEAFYAKNMGMTVEQLRVFNASIGRDIRPCNCEDESCQGWQMTSVFLYEEDQEMRRSLTRG